MDTAPRNVPLSLRVTAAQAKRLNDMAWGERVRLSTWLYEVAIRELERIEKRRDRSGRGAEAAA